VTFYEIVGQAEQLLRERGRLTLRGLQREFALDEADLAALVEEPRRSSPEHSRRL
jgi:hypothetical protein